MIRGAFIAGLCLLSVLQVSTVCAQPLRDPPSAADQAREHASRGQAALDREDFRLALQEYREAHRLYPNPLLLINVAGAQGGLGEVGAAIGTLEAVLADVSLEAARRSEVAAELARLRGLLAALVIDVTRPELEIKVNGAVVGSSPLAAPVTVDPGRVQIEVRGQGVETLRWSGTLASSERRHVRLEVASARQSGRQGSAEPARGSLAAGHRPERLRLHVQSSDAGETDSPLSRPGGSGPVFAWGTAAGALALSLAGMIFGALAIADHDAYQEQGGCPAAGPTTDLERSTCSLRDRGRLRAGVSSGFFVGAGVTAIAAVILFVINDGSAGAEGSP